MTRVRRTVRARRFPPGLTAYSTDLANHPAHVPVRTMIGNVGSAGSAGGASGFAFRPGGSAA
jgi:hypothetical protein